MRAGSKAKQTWHLALSAGDLEGGHEALRGRAILGHHVDQAPKRATFLVLGASSVK